jgi:phosphoribosyl 1,2-cyclic phosphodiesterase/ActR/RegA family two-component response regulator
MSGTKTVLVIDDDAEFRKVVALFLRQKGWPVLEASEGDEGIKLAKTHRPHVILCDLLMPRCNGFQVCRTLRLDESLRQTRIVVTSGRHFEVDRQAALAAGADDFLTKPFDPNSLLSLISREPDGEARSAGPTNVLEPGGPAKTEAVSLRFWGVRGSIPTPGPATVKYGGNTSCLEVRAEGQIIIMDAGTGLRPLGNQLVAEFGDQPLDLTLLLTHTHWDHIQGLPFFLPVYLSRSQLHILGFEGARHGLQNILTSQMESPFFPIGLREVPANITIEELKDLTFAVGPLRVQAAFANHPGICVGFRLFTSAGSIAFFPDNEMHQSSRPTSAGRAAPETAQFARSENQKLIDFLAGTDVLIMDAQYDRDEYLQHVGWGHGCLDEVVDVAIAANVKQLYLFHHDPEHDDTKIDQMVAEARLLTSVRHSAVEIDAAREGLIVRLPVPRAGK